MPWAAPVQATPFGFGNSSSAESCPYSSNVTSGNLLVVWVATYVSSGNITVSLTDSLGNTYTQAGPYIASSSNSLSCWYCVSKAGGANTVSVQPSASCYMGVGILEYVPPGTVSVFGTGSSTTAGLTITVSNLAVSSQDNLVLLGVCQGDGNSSVTASGGYTVECSQPNGFSYEALYVADSPNVTTTQSPSLTSASTTLQVALAVCFEATASGGSVSLSTVSAAWSDNSVTLTASVPLGQESASWTDPAISTLAALAVMTESASWIDPAIAPFAGLALQADSASWTNPALAAAAQIALAAESAAWSNPALNQAVLLALSGQVAAWDNPALTPSGSAGLVLGVESATWSSYPLGIVITGGACPPILAPYLGLEWIVVVPGLASLANECCVISNTEAVTLYRKKSDGTFDNGTAVANALRLEVQKEGVKIKGRLNWYCWASQAGSVPIKPGDYVLDGNGNKWAVFSADVQAWGNRYFLETLQDH